MFTNELWNKPPASATGIYPYQIANSLRLNGTSQALEKTWGSAASDDNKKALSFWIKRTGASNTNSAIGSTTNTKLCSASDFNILEINTNNPTGYSDQFQYFHTGGGRGNFLRAKWRDPSAWMHIVWIYNSDESTTTDRIKVYINGDQKPIGDTNIWDADGKTTYPDSGVDTTFGKNGQEMHIARYQYDDAGWWGGQMADWIMIDGAASISDFGETHNGVWRPKDPSGLTFGNNGFWLKFTNASNPGEDFSGNNNDFSNIGSIATHDQMTDTPTFNSNSNGGNFATLGPLWKTPDMTFSEGNLKWTTSTNQRGAMSNWSIPLEGKYYFEYVPLSWGHSSGDDMWLGLNVSTVDFTASRGGKATCYGYGANSGKKIDGDGTEDSYGASWATNDIIGVAVDRVNDTIQFSKNGSFQGSAFAIPATADLFPWVGSGGGSSSASGVFNFGADGTFAGNVTAGGNSDDTGYGNFKYAVPSGFKALCSGNLPVADAVDPAQTDDYPQKVVTALAYTGDGNTTRSFDIGFKPNLSWVKQRSHTYQHILYDTNRTYATLKALSPDGNWAEGGGGDNSGNGYLSSSDSSGFSVNRGTNTSAGTSLTNTSSTTYASWHWKEGADYGLDIVTYTGTLTGSGVVNISHSLGAIPECIWHMSRGQTGGGAIRHQNLTSANYIMSNNNTMSGSSGDGWGTSAQGDKSGNGNMTALGTSSTFTTNYTGLLNENGNTYVAYVWRGIEGLSKFGSYEGNGNADGPFVYTGFRPAIVINKRIDGNGSYLIHDNSRNTFNVTDKIIAANDGGAEFSGSNDKIDMLSNGFKMRSSNAGINGNGNDYIYMAWAHNPFKYATAR